MRSPVVLRHAYKLINHGPTALVGSAHGERRNLMAAAWLMPLDFNPAKAALVIAEGTYTRELVDASGEVGLSVPVREQVDLTYRVGHASGRTVDKLAGVETFAGTHVKAPLVAGCAAWLEAKVLEVLPQHDLFVLEVLAAWADEAYFAGGEWKRAETLHHVNKGVFFVPSERVVATVK